MKIFNWVHRRFNNKENVKNSDDIGGEDQQFPVENKCNHVFERWRGGILAIGTLGYDPLKDEDQQLNDYFYGDVVVSCEQDQYQRDSDDDDESSDDFGEEEVESDEEEENPLVVAAYSYNAEGQREAEEMEENWKHEFEYVMMEKKERTTLADLFHADSQDHDDDVVLKKQTIADLSKEKSNRKRRRLLFRYNLIAKDARPIHKLNQLMRRMLKRKIHPDVRPINPKVAPVNSNSRTTDDYASLLLTRDANI